MNWLYLLLALVVFALTPSLGEIKRRIPYTVKDGARVEKRVMTRGGPGFVYSRNLPKHVVGALVVSEDGGFYQHPGFDLVAMAEAWRDFRSGQDERLRGASTLTQQLAKNAFLSHERSVVRKLREFFLALRIEAALSKEEILDYYLNVVEFGPGLYGIERASRLYFGVLPEELSLEQAASLFYLLPSPVKRGALLKAGAWDPGRARHVFWCVAQLEAFGWIPRRAGTGRTETEGRDATNQPTSESESKPPIAPPAPEERPKEPPESVPSSL